MRKYYVYAKRTTITYGIVEVEAQSFSDARKQFWTVYHDPMQDIDWCGAEYRKPFIYKIEPSEEETTDVRGC